MVGRRRGSSWWREISRIRDGVREEGRGWFAEGIERRVGNEVETYFWSDLWLGGVLLSVRYWRLFDLSLHRSSTVAEFEFLRMGSGRGGVGVASSIMGMRGRDVRGV
jgi:hypothetical protein